MQRPRPATPRLPPQAAALEDGGSAGLRGQRRDTQEAATTKAASKVETADAASPAPRPGQATAQAAPKRKTVARSRKKS
jgi:hypothetical protein